METRALHANSDNAEGQDGERVCGFFEFPIRLAFVKKGPKTEVA